MRPVQNLGRLGKMQLSFCLDLVRSIAQHHLSFSLYRLQGRSGGIGQVSQNLRVLESSHLAPSREALASTRADRFHFARDDCHFAFAAFLLLCWLLGTSVQNLAVCTSPIFLFFYFPLVKYMELLGEWRTDLPVFSEHGGRCLENLVKTRCVCLVRKARTRAGNRKTRDDSDPITLLRRTCLTHPLLNTLYSAYAARR